LSSPTFDGQEEDFDENGLGVVNAVKLLGVPI
jgi:hypothetical protein